MKTNKKKIPLYKDPKQPVEARVEDLLRRMTVQEKADQLLQETIGRDANPNNIGPDNPFHPTVGSILSYTGGSKARNEYQRAAVENTRLGIPIIWGYDVIHGWRTGFPSSISQAATFRPELTRALSRAAAEECYADGGVNWTFSPMVEVCHDPRWGRVMEGYGEDPHTAREFTKAAVIGYQGKGPADWKKPGHVAACLKHFVGYSASEAGRDYSYTDISGRALWEWYLQPFEAGVEAGARTLMSSFNDITGAPAVCNRYTLDEVLRGMWGFDGFVVSDWGGVSQLKDQGWSADPERQTIECLEAGNEMDMVDGVFKCIPKLVEEGKLSRRTLDEAVRRVLRVKFEIGLFEHPYTPEKPVEETCFKPESLDLALQVARECMTLLKNDGAALPLKPRKGMSVAVIGPLSESRTCHIGAWRAMASVEADRTPNLLEQIGKFFPDAEIKCEKGCGLGEETRVFGPSDVPPEKGTGGKEAEDADARGIARAAALAAKADLVLLCVGEEDWMTGEYASRADLRLPGRQEELAAAVRRAAKCRVVSLVASGRPLALAPLLDASDAVLFMWQGGCRAAEAAMEIAVGRVNPSGRLPMTFPRGVGQVPVYYNEHARSRVWANDYMLHSNGPQFPFGFGLSYTTFGYGAVKVTRRRGGFSASVTVKNTGGRAGQETVIWYITDPEASYTQPRRRVIAFEKIALAPGEEKKVRLSIDSMRDLAYVIHTGEKILEPGAFILSAGGRSEAEFNLEIR